MFTLDSLFDKLADAIVKEPINVQIQGEGKNSSVIIPQVCSTDGMNLKEFVEYSVKEKAEQDNEFASCLENENKSIDECIKYIFGEVAKKMVRDGSYGYYCNERADNGDIAELAFKYYLDNDAKVSPINGMTATQTTHKKTETKVKPRPDVKMTIEKPKMCDTIFGDDDF